MHVLCDLRPFKQQTGASRTPSAADGPTIARLSSSFEYYSKRMLLRWQVRSALQTKSWCHLATCCSSSVCQQSNVCCHNTKPACVHICTGRPSGRLSHFLTTPAKLLCKQVCRQHFKNCTQVKYYKSAAVRLPCAYACLIRRFSTTVGSLPGQTRCKLPLAGLIALSALLCAW